MPGGGCSCWGEEGHTASEGLAPVPHTAPTGHGLQRPAWAPLSAARHLPSPSRDGAPTNGALGRCTEQGCPEAPPRATGELGTELCRADSVCPAPPPASPGTIRPTPGQQGQLLVPSSIHPRQWVSSRPCALHLAPSRPHCIEHFHFGNLRGCEPRSRDTVWPCPLPQPFK